MSTSMSAKDHPNNAPGVPMVYPPTFERLQIKYMNPLVKRIARLMPGVAKVKHRGRKSGKTYETVVTPSERATSSPSRWDTERPTGSRTCSPPTRPTCSSASATVHIVNPRIVPAGGDADGLPFMARVQARKMGVLVADIA